MAVGSVEQVVSLPFLLIGLVLFLMSFSMPYWLIVDNVHNGLWKYCVEINDSDSCVRYNFDSGWIVGVQALECAALGLLLVSLLLSARLFVRKTAPVFVMAALLTTLSGSLALWGTAYFWNHMPDDWSILGWCFYLDIAGAAFIIVAGVPYYVGGYRLSQQPTSSRD